MKTSQEHNFAILLHMTNRRLPIHSYNEFSPSPFPNHTNESNVYDLCMRGVGRWREESSRGNRSHGTVEPL